MTRTATLHSSYSGCGVQPTKLTSSINVAPSPAVRELLTRFETGLLSNTLSSAGFNNEAASSTSLVRDVQAVQIAQQKYVDGHDVEVWQLGRIIGKLKRQE